MDDPVNGDADPSPWAFAVILVAIVAILALVAIGADAPVPEFATTRTP